MKKLIFSIVCCFTAMLSAGDVVLENEYARITLAAGKGFLPSEIYNKITRCAIPFVENGTHGLWSLQLKSGGIVTEITPTSPAEVFVEDNSARLVWREVHENIELVIHVNVQLPEDSGIALWAIAVDCYGENTPLVYAVDFPRLPGIGSIGDDALVIPLIFGKILKNPANQTFSPWPTYPGWWSQQFFAYSGSPDRLEQSYPVPEVRYTDAYFRGADERETGLYYSSDDPTGIRKNMLLNGTKGQGFFTAGMRHFPQWPDTWRNGVDDFNYKIPYAIRMGTFCGNYDTAMEIYKEQVRSYPFLSGGPLKGPGADSGISRRVLENPLFSNNWCAPVDLPIREQRLGDFYQVPMIVHQYAYAMNYFDYSYPDYLPVAPYYQQANRILRKRGTGVMPYVNSIRADLRSRNYTLRNLASDVSVLADGTFLASPMEGNPFVVMSGGKYWTAMHKRLLSYFIPGQEASGYYCDEGGQSVHNLYNSDGQQHGSNEWILRFKNMLKTLRDTAKANVAEPFFSTECCNENYIGLIDSFLLYTLLEAGGGWYVDLNFDHYPIFPKVYHEYSTGHAVPLYPHKDATVSYLSCALNFVWGLQQHSMDPGDEENFKLPVASYSKELVQASYQCASDYLLGGRMLFTALCRNADDMGTAPIAVVSDERTVELWPNWRGPALLGSSWESLNDNSIGIMLAGSVAEDCSGTLIVNGSHEALAGKGSELWQLWPLPAVKIADIEEGKNSIPVQIAENRCMVLALRDSAPPPPRPLVKRDDRVLLRDKETQAFPGWETNSNCIYAGEFFPAQNKLANGSNLVTPQSVAENPAASAESVLDWGLNGEEVPFERVYPIPMQINGDAVVTVYGTGRSFYGVIECDSAVEVVTGNGNRTLFAREDGSAVEALSQGGRWRFLCAPEEFFADQPQVETLFASYGNRYFSHAERDLLAESVAFCNGQTFLAGSTVDQSALKLTDNWLLPGIPRTFEHDFLLAVPDMASGVKRSGNTLTAGELDLGSTLPILFVMQTKEGKFYSLQDLECADPLWMDIAPLQRKKSLDSDGAYSVNLRLRNRSQVSLPVQLSVDMPEGWRCADGTPMAFTLSPQSEDYYQLKLIPDSTDFIQQRIKIYADAGHVSPSVTFASFMALGDDIPLAEPEAAPQEDSESFFCTVYSNVSLLFRTDQDGKISFALTRDATGYTIVDEDNQVVHEERLENPGTLERELQLPSSGIYRMECRSAWLLGVRMKADALLGLYAGINGPVEFYQQGGEFYFHVLDDAEYFEYSTGASIDGGAWVEIFDPEGNQVKAAENIPSEIMGIGNVFRIPVPEQFRGKAWKMKIVPPGQVRIHAGATPYLSSRPENCLASGSIRFAAPHHQESGGISGYFNLPDFLKLEEQNRYLGSMENVLRLQSDEPLFGKYTLSFDCVADPGAFDNRFALYVTYLAEQNGTMQVITSPQFYIRIANNGERHSYSVDLDFVEPVTQAAVVVHTGRIGRFDFDNFVLNKEEE